MEQKETKINGLIITGYGKDYIYKTIESRSDFYEGEILREWTPMLGKSRVIFDVGANIGNHSLYWALNLKPNKIYAFEPYSPNFIMLKKNIEINNMDYIEAVNISIGEGKGFVSVKSSDEENMGATVYQNAESGDEMISLDDFCYINAIEDVDFIKIDTEGFELNVINGMRNILTKNGPDLWIETASENCVELIKELGNYSYLLADIKGANLLFLNPSRHHNMKEIEKHKILFDMLKYLEKTNLYYRNYEKAKSLLAEAQSKNNYTEANIKKLHSDIKTDQLKIQEYAAQIKRLELENERNQESIQEVHELRAKIADYNDRFRKMKEEQDQLNAELVKAVDECRQTRDQTEKYVNIIRQLVAENDDSVKTLLEAQKEIKQLRVQRDYLNSENQIQKEKLSKIYDTWYGKILLKSYKVLKKCRAAVRRFKNKLFL